MDNDQFPEGKTRTEPGARLVIPSPGWLCWPFSPALSSSGFHGNMLFLVFSSFPVSVWRTDLYSFVQPWVTASVSSLLLPRFLHLRCPKTDIQKRPSGPCGYKDIRSILLGFEFLNVELHHSKILILKKEISCSTYIDSILMMVVSVEIKM